MSDKDQQQEPSMEEILASIRRIIAEEEPEGEAEGESEGAEDAPVAAPEAAAVVEDVLDLTEVVEDESSPETERPDLAMAEQDQQDEKTSQDDIDAMFGGGDVEEETPTDESPTDESPFDEILAEEGSAGEDLGGDDSRADGLTDEWLGGEPAAEETPSLPSQGGDSLMSETTQAATAAALASLTGAMGPQAGGGQPVTPGGRTLEDLVAELLKPMLKQWLDDNLPPLVERLVRQEIERLADRVRS